MKRFLTWILPAVLVIAAASWVVYELTAAELVKSKDGTVVGYKDTPVLPWAEPYRVHDPDRPWPPVVAPGVRSRGAQAGTAPSDALVLFDGGDLSAWRDAGWTVEDGVLVAGKGDLVTVETFGDCQLHLEWQAPDPPRGKMTNRGNSGVFFMGKYEIQIFDSYTEKIYPDGIAGAVYGETPPLVHPARKPGRWQSYDIVFTAPVFADGTVVEPATVTMLFNGVLVHFNTEIRGPCAWRKIAPYKPHPPKLPLKLQAHGNPVRFRNIWIRRLELGSGDGGTKEG